MSVEGKDGDWGQGRAGAAFCFLVHQKTHTYSGFLICYLVAQVSSSHVNTTFSEICKVEEKVGHLIKSI